MNLEKYKQALAELKAGKLSPARFKGIRVPWGIYSHRGGQIYMMRVRIPAGIVTAEQLRALAEVSKKYGNGRLHITTRQDIQVHEIRIEDTLEIMEFLEKHNLSPRGGGGNTVRNITACEAAGICDKEVFDVRGPALALTEYLLGQENSFNLPRKFKIGFAGCEQGWRNYRFNDVGLLAATPDGFRVFAGGGMGAHPHVGIELEERVPIEEIGWVVEAVKKVFDRHGNRKDRHRSRLGFLIEEVGFERFKQLYKEELAKLREKNSAVLRKVVFPEKDKNEAPAIEGRDNVRPQKQGGYSMVELRIPQGDISADELSRLADLKKDFPGMEFLTTQGQNLILTWVKNQEVDRLLEKINDFSHPSTLLDVTVCKGAQTCNLGICNSPALAKEIEKMIQAEFLDSEVFKKLDIKINGCPNACARHPVGKLAFHGMVKKVGNRPMPFYKFLMGAEKKGDSVKLAEEVGALPAKNVPAFLRELLRRVNVSKEVAAEIILKYSRAPAYEEDRDFYIDWGKNEDFSLAGIGPGECGAGVIEMIESDLNDARRRLEAGDFYKALVFSARALLVVKGIEPRTDEEIFSKFRESFVEEGIIAYRLKEIAREGKPTRAYAEELYREVEAAYRAMDSNFHFALREEVKKEAGRTIQQGNLMDLRGVKCPINYVKAKMKLETLQEGDKLLLYLDPGEPIKNVPASLKNDGQDILKIEEKDNYFEVLVKKEV